ncbi:MAG: hypothetical protein SFW65_00570 [Alphaproteobacteria bacterium]|nr:hypothetical protein [Alphaproteobacteria bacterium]
MSKDQQSKKNLPKNFTRGEDGTLFVKPDLSLKKKLGMGKSIKAMLNTSAIEKAEAAMQSTLPELMNEIKGALKTLQRIVGELKPGAVASDEMRAIIEKSFEIKGKAGFCNYPMASSFSRFLYLFCEGLVEQKITAQEITMISTCVNILTVIFERNFEGEGDNESIEDFIEDGADKSPFADL